MVSAAKLTELRRVITENLRVQRDGNPIDYINVGTALDDSCARQNHAIFARRGWGKTLLLHHSSRIISTRSKSKLRAIYLNCEDFKRHSFPNVLIEILSAIFRELDRNFGGWFGKKKKAKQIIVGIVAKLDALQKSADSHDEEVRSKKSGEASRTIDGSAGVDIDKLHLKFGAKTEGNEKQEIEKSFRVHREKLQELDRWLPELKEGIRSFFNLPRSTDGLLLQIDDLYHLKRTDQAFVVDYIHRLCKDLPLYFKIATLRHASTLYADRDGQPIGAQERRHDTRARIFKLLDEVLLCFNANRVGQFEVKNDRVRPLTDEVNKFWQILADAPVRLLPNPLGFIVDEHNDDFTFSLMVTLGVETHGRVLAQNLHTLDDIPLTN
jgi:hypothetical protein